MEEGLLMCTGILKTVAGAAVEVSGCVTPITHGEQMEEDWGGRDG